MKKFMQKRLKNEKGMTLIELLAVIVILAVIAAIAIPAIGKIIENSRVGALKSDGQNALAAANIYFTDTNDLDNKVTVTELATAGYMEDTGSLTGGSEVTKTTGGNKITGAASEGGITVTFTKATNSDIALLKNSADAIAATDASKKSSSDATVVVTGR